MILILFYYSLNRIAENQIRYHIQRILPSNSLDSEVKVCYVIFIGEHGEMKNEKKTLIPNQNNAYETKIEKWMISLVNMIVLTRALNGEFIFDATKVVIEPRIKNTMEIQILPENKTSNVFQPGQPFKIKLSVNENNDERSSIHLLSVDERFQFFSNDGDISNIYMKDRISKFDDKNDKMALPPVDGRSVDKFNELSKFNAFIITNMSNAEVSDKNISLVQKRSVSINDMFYVRTKRSKEIPIVRRNFPKVFMFSDIPGSELQNNEYTLKTNAPHNIANFIVSGFIFHPVHGLGVAKNQKFGVRKDFFIEVSSPDSIHVGQVIRLNVAAFNRKSLNEKLEANITVEMLENDYEFQDDFEFVELKRNGTVCFVSSLIDKLQVKNIVMMNGTESSTHFLIQAKSDGKIRLKVSAAAGYQTDTILKEIIVEPQGIRKSNSKKYMVDLRKDNHSSHLFICEFPSNIVGSTKRVSATVHGNKMVPFLLGIDRLIKSLPGKM